MSSVFVHQEDDDRQGTDEDSIYRSAKSYYTLTNLHTCQLPDETDSRQISDPLEFDDDQSVSVERNDLHKYCFLVVEGGLRLDLQRCEQIHLCANAQAARQLRSMPIDSSTSESRGKHSSPR